VLTIPLIRCDDKEFNGVIKQENIDSQVFKGIIKQKNIENQVLNRIIKKEIIDKIIDGLHNNSQLLRYELHLHYI